ncbi:hypothetical protein PV04_04429 [Phialophora macrospora]|uniref:Uncharacterized protein n=1 Tax=Phialophora macrospora TaxID=1851006 RepID=A0A0D2E2G8_9EURO|nr:hypothetical protein PV04_04429 [Phialophora macrospora]
MEEAPAAHPGSDGMINTDDAKLRLLCITCGKTYTRLDHLVRHRRSHTQVKPFSCHVCGKDFARADVLKRHVFNHDHYGPSDRRRRQMAPDGKPRVAKACAACATAKLRCEDEKPCRRCVQKKLSCYYPDLTASPAEGTPTTVTTTTTSPTERHQSTLVFSASTAQQTDRATVQASDTSISDHQFSSMLTVAHASQQPFLVSSTPVTQQSAADLMVDEGTLSTADTSIFTQQTPDSYDDSSLVNFLTDIMLPWTPAPNGHPLPNEQLHLRDFLDFGAYDVHTADLEAMLETSHGDTMQLGPGASSNPLPSSETRTPAHSEGLSTANAAFMRSMWMWTPTNRDYSGLDNLNLSLPYADMDSPETRVPFGHLAHHPAVDTPTRDKILAYVLTTCDAPLYVTIASSFPNAQILTRLMQFYMTLHLAQKDPWLHFPTMEVDDGSLDLVITMISAGATLYSVPAIRRLGFALQDAARTLIIRKFESNNRLTRDLRLLQAFALQLEVALWSGDKRRMELAESASQPLITASMMRRAGRLSSPKSQTPAPTVEDSDEILDLKWRQWVQAESYKRFACHLLIHDAQASMACQVPPILSPAELCLSFPASKDLWEARSAGDWSALFGQLGQNPGDRGGSGTIAEVIYDVSQLEHQSNIDFTFAATIVVYSTWTLGCPLLRHKAVLRPPSMGHSFGESSLMASHRTGILYVIDHTLLVLSGWDGLLHPEMTLVAERILLNLHVSFEQVQRFAGKEGVDEARRAYPLLQQWAESSNARKAVWHAGQIVKAAKACSPNALRSFGAICLYHAGLTLWAYAVVQGAIPSKARGQGRPSQALPTTEDATEVWLDGDDSPAVQRFITLNRGVPLIHDSATEPGRAMSLKNARPLMELCISLLRKNTDIHNTGDCLPLIENLSQLMRDLGKAAQGLLLGELRGPEHIPRTLDDGGGAPATLGV